MKRILGLFFVFSAAALAQPGWTQLANTTLTSVCPTGTSGSCAAVIESWSGATFDSTRNRMVIWGGGHGDYNGNEVYAVYPPGATLPGAPAVCSSATAPAICRIKDHSPTLRAVNDASGSFGGCWTTEPNGTDPNDRHTYSGLAYIANLDKMFVNGGSLTCGNGSHAGDTWLLDLPTLGWTAQDPATNGGGSLIPKDICTGCFATGQGPQSMSVYDPVRQLVFTASAIFSSTAGANVWSYSAATNTYVTRTTSFPIAFNASWVVDPKRHKIFAFGNNTNGGLGNATTQMGTAQINSLDISAGGTYATGDLSNTSGTCDGLAGSINPGLVYWATLDRIVGWPNFGNTVYIYNPDTNRCTSQTFTGGPPDSKNASLAVETTGTYGRMQYFPALDAAIIVNDADNNAYMLKLASNSMTVTNTGSSTTNYPVQIGRAFAQGEIPNGSLPQATVDGSAVSTQVDVKARWGDASLKHAVISFLIPTFNAAQVSTVTFAAGTTAGNTALTKTQMAAVGYNFDALISITKGGVTKGTAATTGALKMLNDSTSIPDCNTVTWSTQTGISACYWNQGPIATTVIFGNHSQSTTCGGNAASTYDFGFDSFCAFRPEYEATFWPGAGAGNLVKVRFIGEIANTEQLEDIALASGDSITLTAGSTAPATVYSRTGSALTMRAATRWTKVFWLNGTPPEAAYNHNLAYLAATLALPNYDTTKTGSITNSDLAAEYTLWNSAAKNLYSAGEIDQPESAGGAHKYIGPMPGWNARWLMSGDLRAQEETIGTDGAVSTVAGGPAAVTVGNSELAATFEIHYREGNCAKLLYGATNGCGHAISITSRPTWSYVNGYASGVLADRVVPVGTTTGVWGADVAHLPQFYYSTYLVTGDHFYYDEDTFFQTWATIYAGNDTSTFNSRGPTGTEGGFPDWANQIMQARGQGWAGLHRAELAWITPDAAPEKAMWNAFMNNNIDFWEGQRVITTGRGHTTGALACASGGGSTCTVMWNWGYNTAFPGSGNKFWSNYDGNSAINLGVPPLHFWTNSNGSLCQDIIDMTVTEACGVPWMLDYVYYGLGRASELGYATSGLLAWGATYLNGGLTDPTFNPYLMASYRMPVQDLTPNWKTTWGAVKSAYLSASCGSNNGNCQTETDYLAGLSGTSSKVDPDSDVQPLLAAAAMEAGQANGGAAWSFAASTIGGLTSLRSDYKWFILPRSTSSQVLGTPAVTLGATSHSFGNQPLSLQSAGFDILLTNSGNAVLTITSITPSGDYSDTSDCPLSPSTLGIATSCTITARFTPAMLGVRSGNIVIVDNAGDTPQTITLTGTGVPALSGSFGTGIFGGQVIIQ